MYFRVLSCNSIVQIFNQPCLINCIFYRPTFAANIFIARLLVLFVFEEKWLSPVHRLWSGGRTQDSGELVPLAVLEYICNVMCKPTVITGTHIVWIINPILVRVKGLQSQLSNRLGIVCDDGSNSMDYYAQ